MPRKKAVKEEPLEEEAVKTEEVEQDVEAVQAETSEAEAAAETVDAENELDENAGEAVEDEMSKIDEANEKAEKEQGAEAVDAEDEPVEEYVISDRMMTLFESAIYNKEILTGMLFGVERTSKGIVANVIYNGNNEDNLLFDSVTVKISAEEMGLDNAGIERHIRSRAARRGLNPSPSVFEREKRRLQRGLLSNMLGAKVDFIPNAIFSDRNVVTASRAKAMERRRRNVFPSSRNAMPTIGVNSKINARIIRVTPISMVVEATGFETVLNASQVTPMAIDLTARFKPGDSLPVTIQKVTEDSISVVATAVNKVDVKRRVREHKIGSICIGKVYYHNGNNGKYFIQLPNGCRGLSYYEKSILHLNPKTGDTVRFRVTGYTPNGRVVRCRILGIC